MGGGDEDEVCGEGAVLGNVAQIPHHEFAPLESHWRVIAQDLHLGLVVDFSVEGIALVVLVG